MTKGKMKRRINLKLLKRNEFKEYYSVYYPILMKYWQKNFIDSRLSLIKSLRIKNKLVLDIGCGNGIMLRGLIKNNDVFGVDISDKFVKQAMKNGISAKKVDLDCEDLPYPREKFDIILIFDVFEHVFYPRRLLKKCKKILKNNGKIYLTLPNLEYPNRIIDMKESLIKDLYKIFGENIPPKALKFPDINIWSITKLRATLDDLDMSISKIKGFNGNKLDILRKDIPRSLLIEIIKK